MNKYDVIIVGAGPSGIFSAMELNKLNESLKILLIDEGKPVDKRVCPKDFNGGTCINCDPCMVMSGFSGSGAFSDAKLTLYDDNSNEVLVGGNLPNVIGHQKVKDLIDYVDSTYLSFGAEKSVSGLSNLDKIKYYKDKFTKSNLSLVNSPIRHMGTEKSQELYYKIQCYLSSKENIEIMFKTKVDDLAVENKAIRGIKIKDKVIYSDKIILSVGRKGSSWLESMCKKHFINHNPGTIDIGIRYELPDAVMKDINELLYEMKVYGRPMPFGDKVRSFCQNPSGYVTGYKLDKDITLCNGHSFKEKKSTNTNLALLVSMNFTEPFKEPIKFGKNISRNVNMLAGDNVLVQRYGDILRGKRTWDEDLKNNSVKPTLLDAVPGDITNGMPYRVIQNIVEYIRMVDKVIEGFGHPDNLIYAPEVKFYSNNVTVNEELETNIRGLYAIGDGSGLTRGLMMASCAGVHVAQNISKKSKA